jgi:exopolysaccharide biosynthesis polyprenyl glycosylphosphotransferase
VWGIPLIRVKRAALRTRAWRVKRAFDLVVATAALVVAAPMFGLIALAVRLSSPGPVLFRQKRVGQGGQLVEVLKFRTLQVNDDSDKTWSVVTDVRVTPIGRVLRATSLDELPQLINVIRGDMSLVGPRPERPHFVSEFNERVARYDDRHRVPVGITGWAQVHGLRGDTSIEERARFDNRYIEHWSLWRDVVILGRTVAAVVRDTVTLRRG